MELPFNLNYFLTFAMLPCSTRKLSYRKDDRAMRPMYGRPENFPVPDNAHGYLFLMDYCSD